jgi:protein-S-isoprenylcysteine O-methyltransferase Ste14
MPSEEFDIRKLMFRARSYTPIPFLVLMVIFARPTLLSIVSGFTLLMIGECLRFWGVSIAGAETRTTGTVGGTYLITTGPFAFVRNPLYVGNMLVYTGVGVMSWAVFPWLLLVAIAWFFVQYSLIITGEEEYLRLRFGQEFASYCREVRRFVPRLTPYRPADPPPKSMDVREGFSSETRTLQAIGLVTAVIVLIYIFR